MIKPKIGVCTKCNQNTEIWEGYNDSCTNCFNDQKASKFTIEGVPLVNIVENILMDQPRIKKIVETAILERGSHSIIRLEDDGRIYKAEPEWRDKIQKTPEPKKEARPHAHPADPELVSKLNSLIDEHISNCCYCQGIIDENTVL